MLQFLACILFHKRSGGFRFPFLRFFLPFSCGLFFLPSKYISLQDLAAQVPIDRLQLLKSLDLLMLSEQVVAQSLFSDIRTTN